MARINDTAEDIGDQLGGIARALGTLASDLKVLMADAASMTRGEAGEHLGKIQSHAKELSENLGVIASETAQQGYHRLGEEMGELRQRLEVLYDDLKTRGESAAEGTRETIRERPFSSIGGAFAAGYIVAMLLGRK